MTAAELEAMLAKTIRFRADLLRQWTCVMHIGDEPIPPEIEAIRAAIIADNDFAEAQELRVRRALVELRAGVAMDAALVDLIARYKLPGWN